MMKPTASRLLVRVLPEAVPEPKKEENTAKNTGNDKKEAIPVILPTVKGNTVITANVVDVGPLVREVSRGDKVIFSPYGFDEVQMGGEKLVIIDETMILAYENHGKNKGTGK